MSLVELGRYPTRVDAELARLALGAGGIEAVILDAEANNFFGGGGLIWVRLMVLDEDLDDARELLAANP
jgi:Putative prokaryotic signal transducing protein